MAPPSFSPDTSTSSHTLSVGSAHPPPMDLGDASSDMLSKLHSTLQSPTAFLTPTLGPQRSTLSVAKQYLDGVASAVSEHQAAIQQHLRKKRKRGDQDGDIRVLHLKKLHLEGFGVNQVFEQTRKVLDASINEVELYIPKEDDDRTAIQDEDVDDDIEDAEEEDSVSSLGEEGVDWEYDGEDISGEEGVDDDDLEEEDVDAEDIESQDDQDEAMFSEDDSAQEEPAETYRPDPNGLNDGFFSIDDFNKTSEFLEQRDAQGEPMASDDEEIDWDGDPFAAGSAQAAKKRNDDTASQDESDEEGPTFGNVDLNAPEGDSEDDEMLEDGGMDGMGDMSNANNVMYADFFMPPAQKAGKNRNKNKRGRPNPHNFPSAADPQNNKPEEMEDDVERTMGAVHRDLFEDDDDAESEGDLTDLDPSDPKSRRSTHERRQAKLAEEIRRLEAANVAKRDWQLSGEARAADRPMNSLLEEDLDFERAGKPVPVITAEVSEDIEALIKRRIIASEFDELHRRRPDDLATGPKVRRGRMEVDDTKSSKGLAEIYEEEHLRNNDPNFVDARDEALKKEHAEIDAMWKSISGKLDSLCSWHYKPKPAAANLEIRVDAPAIEMEDARPTAGGDVASSSMLAPQELYKPGQEKNNTEVVTKSGMPIAREEMTREQKLRRRRREKAKIKKGNANKPLEENGKETKVDEQKKMLGDLKRGGVQVIGKRGQVTDVEGKSVAEKAKGGAGNFKL